MKRHSFEFTHFAQHRGPSELNNASIDGDVAAKNGERVQTLAELVSVAERAGVVGETSSGSKMA